MSDEIIAILILSASNARKNAMNTARLLKGRCRSIAVCLARSNNHTLVR